VILDDLPIRRNARSPELWFLICTVCLSGCGTNGSSALEPDSPISAPVGQSTTAASLQRPERPRGVSIARAANRGVDPAPREGADPSREAFELAYAHKAPWDIGRPQSIFVEVADQVQGTILDAGCGTGDIALFFAGRGHAVVGIDFVDFPIQQANRKARQRGLAAEFICMDALTLTKFDRKFDNVIDSGLFHCFTGDSRTQYVAGLAHVIVPGGKVWLLCSREGISAPKAVSQHDLQKAFGDGWTIEAINAAKYALVPSTPDSLQEGGLKAWFAVIRRNG